MDILMERVQLKKHEHELRDECEKLRKLLRNREKDLFVARTRLACEIHEKKQAQDRTACLEIDLMKTAQELEETGTTLKVLMEQRRNELTEFEERVVFNLKKITLPYIDRLWNMVLDRDSLTCLEIIETNINKVMRPLIHTTIPQRADLTPTEIKVAILISEGMTSKEISNLISISTKGVEYHRNNIRRKLGIKKQNVNLRKYLAYQVKADTGTMDAALFLQKTPSSGCGTAEAIL